MNTALKNKLRQLPAKPGVYFHKSASGEIIYVGKAAVLKNRVRQYFQTSRSRDTKTMALVAEIADTDWIETDSEIDALFLESEMVKRYMPRYNILLRDDRSQMYVRIDMKNDWPTVSFTRNPIDDGAEYVGPFFNGYALKKALRYLRKVFPYLTRQFKAGQSRLDEDLGLSPRRSEGSAAYKADLKKLISYIKGNRKALVVELEKQMKQAASQQDFELAAQYRNKLRHMHELQQRVMFGDSEFLDISKDQALSDLAKIFSFDKEPVRIEAFDVSHISGQNVVASMVVFSNGVSDRAAYRKFKVTERNDDVGNIYQAVFRRLSPRNISSWGLPDLVLIDGGKSQLASAILAMQERAVTVPIISIAKRADQLIVSQLGSNIDTGSLLQLSQANPRDIQLTKEGSYLIVDLHGTGSKSSGHAKNLRASTDQAIGAYRDVVYLIQRIRDEAHRFAISYHSALRRQGATTNQLESISGVGPKTRAKLMKRWGSMAAIARASEEELEAVIGKRLALIVFASLSSR